MIDFIFDVAPDYSLNLDFVLDRLKRFIRFLFFILLIKGWTILNDINDKFTLNKRLNRVKLLNSGLIHSKNYTFEKRNLFNKELAMKRFDIAMKKFKTDKQRKENDKELIKQRRIKYFNWLKDLRNAYCRTKKKDDRQYELNGVLTSDNIEEIENEFGQNYTNKVLDDIKNNIIDLAIRYKIEFSNNREIDYRLVKKINDCKIQ